MSRSTIQPINIKTEIDGVATKGMLAFGMQAVIVENDDNDIIRYWVISGTEVAEGTVVKEGDVLGLPGRLPEMLMVGPAKYTFPKTFQIYSGGLIKIEGIFYGSDGNFYIARLCTVAILQDDDSVDRELCLRCESVEQEFYSADESIIKGKTVSNVISLYGFKEEEILDDEKDLPLHNWLENKRSIGQLYFMCPYEFLLWMEVDMNNLSDVLIKRVFHQS